MRPSSPRTPLSVDLFFNIVYDCVGMQSDSLSLSLFLCPPERISRWLLHSGMLFLLEFEGLLSRISLLSRAKGNSFSLYDGEPRR